MDGIKAPSIILKEKIDKNDYDAVKSLEKICVEKDNVSFKLELEYKLNNSSEASGMGIAVNDFMFYDESDLKGYIGINDFGGDALEVNGMVHPEYRNRGIFTKLFSLVNDEWLKRKQLKMLMLSDHNSASGIEFIKNMCGEYDHSEYDMILNMDVKQAEPHNVKLREAVKNDYEEIARQDRIYFEIEKDDVQNIEQKYDDNNGSFTYMAEAGNQIIGKVRIEMIDRVGGIYGLGVLPEHRSNGFGREVLISAIKRLKENGAHKIMLQVEVNNKNALSLYKSCGFEENYVMDYYRISKNQV